MNRLSDKFNDALRATTELAEQIAAELPPSVGTACDQAIEHAAFVRAAAGCEPSAAGQAEAACLHGPVVTAEVIPLPVKRLVIDPQTLEMLAGYRALPAVAKPLFVTVLRAMAEHWEARRLKRAVLLFVRAAKHPDPDATADRFMRASVRAQPPTV